MSFSTVITTTNAFILCMTLILVLYYYFKRTYTYWSRRGVTTPPCSFPLGNLNDVAFNGVPVQEMFKKLYTDLKPKGIPYSGFYLFFQPVLVVFDIDLIKSIMVKDFTHFTNHGALDKRDYDIYGGNLFCLKGAEWKKMREILSPLFTSGKLKLMFPVIENCSNQLLNLINQAAQGGESLNIEDIAGRYTTDVIASVAFGIESNSLKDPTCDFRKYAISLAGHGSKVNELRLVIQMILPNLIKSFKMTLISTDITNYFHEIVQNVIAYREKNNIVRKDFMQLMIQLKNNVDVSDQGEDCFNLKVNSNLYSLSIEEVVAQTMLFVVAGYDASCTTISFCMYELALQQDIQEKLRDEITTVLNKHEGQLSYDAIMEMTYMGKCIKETLRKYPLLPSLFRECTETYQVPNSDLIIEKGILVFIPTPELHYDPEYFPNPNKFDPERFSNENISARNPFTYLPYGNGPRVCMGIRLGMIQIKVALTRLLSHYRYTLNSKTAYPLKRAPRSLLGTSEKGIWLNVDKIIV